MVTLRDSLARAGRPPALLEAPDGSRLLALPDHGRLLGLYPAEGDENFLWTHSALSAPGPAAACFTPGGWSNPGGDRTWLAPEIDLFVGDPARPFETYMVPPALDPGNWTLSSATAAELSLANETRLRLHRPDREVGVRLVKRFSPAANPLQGASPAVAGLHYAGYTLVTTLEVEPKPDAPLQLGIWNLLQLPQAGTMLIPTQAPVRPQVVFGTLSSAELTSESCLVRWNMAAPGDDAKIAIQAQSLTGRAGHLHETVTPGIWELVVREFGVDPAGDYVDVLWDDPEADGWGFQACCVRSGTERFNELEYHAPAATAVPGKDLSRDESRVWAFRGPTGSIAGAAEVLLGRSVPVMSDY